MVLGQLPASWAPHLSDVMVSVAVRKLAAMLRADEAAGKVIYPPQAARLKALELTPLDAVKVVLLGQDPYHGPGQAMGLSFSVPQGAALPPSLRNIYKELEEDCSLPAARHGDLTAWAQQGVLLLNSALSVEAGKAGSHAAAKTGGGWEAITDACIKAVAAREAPCVFILWGSHAQKKAAAAARHDQHLVLSAPHPSPLSAYRGFFGSKPFSKANAFLKQHGQSPIDWGLPQAPTAKPQTKQPQADQPQANQPQTEEQILLL
jgi:uracil-DNA glycosylase